MATNRKLREDLLAKLNITQQALSARVKKKKRLLPMSTEDATHLIAHESGLSIDRYLDSDAVSRIRQLTAGLAVKPQSTPVPVTARKSSGGNNDRTVQIPSEFRLSDPVLPPAKLNQAIDMAAVYPLLYTLENSIRAVIRRVMAAKHGEDWWDTQLKSNKLRSIAENVANRMKKEAEQSWHQPRGVDPLDYVDFGDLQKIILAKESDFIPEIISDKEWFKSLIRDIAPSRNVLCHMNPLDKTNIQDIKVKCQRWKKMISKNLKNIP